MRNLKKFDTVAAYNAAESGLILPNVSLITETHSVAYKPSSPITHDYVEIDGIKWATMNIGAESITDTGLYFQWGDTQGYTAAQVGTDKNFTWDDYKFNPSGDGSTMTKYNSTDGKIVLDLSDDAVNAAWGGGWRMPTTEEFQTLGNAVDTAFTQVNGVYGLQCTDKNDSSKVLFFPACGVAVSDSVDDVGNGGFYWSKSRVSNYQLGYELNFGDGYVIWDFDMPRFYGYVVRGVLDE